MCFENSAFRHHLPIAFRARYDDAFVELFRKVLNDVYVRVTSGSEVDLVSPAEEIALAMLVEAARDQAAGLGDMAWAIWSEGDDASLDRLRTVIVSDIDVDFLWDPAADGVWDDEAIMALAGIGDHLKYDNWFKPYGPDDN